MSLSYEERLKSFSEWKPASGLSTFDVRTLQALARSGLYFNKAIDGNDDPGRLRCQFCPAVISNWRPTDDVWIEHLTATNKICIHIHLLKGADFITEKLSKADLQEASTNDNCLESIFNLIGLEEPTRIREHHGSGVLKACNDMKDRASRLATFDRVCTTEFIKRNREILADAGFYFVGLGKQGDSVTCYCCGRSLYDHKDWDDPWEQHAQFKCRHVFVKKGLEFVKIARQRVSRCESGPVGEASCSGKQISGAKDVSNKRKQGEHDEKENHEFTNTPGPSNQKYWQLDSTDKLQERNSKRICQRSIHRKERHRGEEKIECTSGDTDCVYLCCSETVPRNEERGPCPRCGFNLH